MNWSEVSSEHFWTSNMPLLLLETGKKKTIDETSLTNEGNINNNHNVELNGD